MKWFLIALSLICIVCADDKYPGLIIAWPEDLAVPKILRFGTDKTPGFDLTRDTIWVACPASTEAQFKVNNEESSYHKALFKQPVEGNFVHLDELPSCKSPPQVVTSVVDEGPNRRKYSVGYQVCLNEDYEIGEYEQHSDKYTFSVLGVYAFYYDIGTEIVISADYEMKCTEYCLTASNAKRVVEYEENINLLEFDLDHQYENFKKEISPLMVAERDANQLAHQLGIQKVQLAPHDDFLLDAWKTATFSNLNTVAIWKVLIPRWNAIEIYLRKLTKKNVKLKVETGSSEIPEFMKRYYGEDTVTSRIVAPPMYVWKLVYREYRGNEAILIIMHNDPFTEHQKPLCDDICAPNGWFVSDRNHRTGLVYCCETSADIANVLGYADDKDGYRVNDLIKDARGEENVSQLSRFLSDRRHSVYDW